MSIESLRHLIKTFIESLRHLIKTSDESLRHLIKTSDESLRHLIKTSDESLRHLIKTSDESLRHLIKTSDESLRHLIKTFIESLRHLIKILARPQSEPDVSEGLREQIVNIISDLVDEIVPGYLLPDSYFFNYKNAIYERIYKSLWDELGERRLDDVDFRDEIFDLLRSISSEKFFNGIEYLLKEVYWIVHIQSTIPDDIILNPSADNEPWSRKESVRDRHISRFKGAIDKLNYRLSQNDVEYRYKLSDGFVQMVRLHTGLDVSEEDSGIQEPDDNQTTEHHRGQNRSEFWNRKNYIITVVLLILTALVFLFGDGILIPPLRWFWNYLQTTR